MSTAPETIQIQISERSFDDVVREVEAKFLAYLVKESGGNKAKAARLAGMSTSRFYDRFSKLKSKIQITVVLDD